MNKKLVKIVEFYSYEGNDHNLANSFDTAMERSIEFFDKHLGGRDTYLACTKFCYTDKNVKNY